MVLGVWEEVVGVLVYVDLPQGLLEFEGFHLRVDPEALENVPLLKIGDAVRILRTDSRETPLILTSASRARQRPEGSANPHVDESEGPI